MGKHDKKVEPASVFRGETSPDEFYKARIKYLEKENLKLSEKVQKLEKTLSYMERRVETTERWGTKEVVNLEKALLNAAKMYWGEE